MATRYKILHSGNGLELDQTTPQTVANGSPIFSTGINITGTVLKTPSLPTSDQLDGVSVWLNSGVLTLSGLPTVATPTIDPNGGSFNSTQSVTLACSTSGASIYYTENGVDPTTGDTLYTGAFNVSVTETVKAKAFHSGYNPSAVASAGFTIGGPPDKPDAPTVASISIKTDTQVDILTNIPALSGGADTLNAMYSPDSGLNWIPYCNNVTPSSQYTLQNIEDAGFDGGIQLRIDAVNTYGTTSSDATNVTRPTFSIQSATQPAIVSGGTGYTPADSLTISGGTYTVQLTMDVTETDSGGNTNSPGVITGVSCTAVGNYTIRPVNSVSVTGGTGADATFNITWQTPSL